MSVPNQSQSSEIRISAPRLVFRLQARIVGQKEIAKVVLVSENDEDVVYGIVSTTRESQYEKFDEQPPYRITFQEIESVEKVAPRREPLRSTKLGATS